MASRSKNENPVSLSRPIPARRPWRVERAWVWDRLYQPGDTVLFTDEDAAYFTTQLPGTFTAPEEPADSEPSSTKE